MPPGTFLVATSDFGPIVLVRLLVGWAFVVEGVFKFLRPGERGAGLFEGLGIPFPDLMARTVGGTEVLCGLLVLLGVGVRVSVVPLMAILLAALLAVRLPLLGAEGLVGFLHASLLETVLLLACAFLLRAGAGPLSMDRKWWTEAREGKATG